MSVRQPDSGSGNAKVTIALIAPEEERRREIVKVLSAAEGWIVHEFNDYPGVPAVCSLLSRAVES